MLVRPIPPTILQPVEAVEQDGEDDGERQDDDDGDLGGDVLRRVAGLEGLGPDDVADAEGH